MHVAACSTQKFEILSFKKKNLGNSQKFGRFTGEDDTACHIFYWSHNLQAESLRPDCQEGPPVLENFAKPFVPVSLLW